MSRALHTASGHLSTAHELDDGVAMPQLGFGAWQAPEDRTAATAETAIVSGDYSIDTAAIYGMWKAMAQRWTTPLRRWRTRRPFDHYAPCRG